MSRMNNLPHPGLTLRDSVLPALVNTLSRLHDELTAIGDALSCAADAKASLSREMMCWSVASFLLTDQSMFDDSVRILKKAGRLPYDLAKKGTFIGSESPGYGSLYALVGRRIQEYLVIPYLKRAAK